MWNHGPGIGDRFEKIKENLRYGDRSGCMIQSILPGLLSCFLIFYILPFLGRDTGSFMLILLLVTPTACLVISLVQGYRTGFVMMYPFLVGLLFAPTLILFYNYTAWIYIVIYVLIAVAGMAVGSGFSKRPKTS